MLQNHKLVVSYDGTDYRGWQKQPQERTVQGELEAALAKISGQNIPIVGAGRTDAGVHAQGQTAHFKAKISLPLQELRRAFNALLPQDIRVIYLEKVGTNFHSRKSAKSKVYQYRIFNSPLISPFVIRYVYHWSSSLNLKAMQEAARLFRREADFSPFSSNHKLNPVKKVIHSEVKKRGAEIIYTVEANGFLKYMVRTMVGTLLEIGRERMKFHQVEDIFQKGERSMAGPTVPAKGLCLIKVKY